MPALTIRDPELVRSILVKDFDHFVDRQENHFKLSSGKTDQVKFASFQNITIRDINSIKNIFTYKELSKLHGLCGGVTFVRTTKVKAMFF
jgi:hypothetical protein